MNEAPLSTLELLEKLIGVEEARRLYAGSLGPLFRDTNGNDAYPVLAAAHELVKRYVAEGLNREVILTSPGLVAEYLRVHFAGLEHETFVGLFLDTQHRLLAIEQLASGTIDGASVYPREVVKRALHHNAAALIFAHNHPSGVAEPSTADKALTTRLQGALAVVDIRVLDHLVVAGHNSVSLAERGWL